MYSTLYQNNLNLHIKAEPVTVEKREEEVEKMQRYLSGLWTR